MKSYKDKITLIKNNRGCYVIDTIKGCGVCLKDKPDGCYGDCYAKRISSRYGFDFSHPIKRDFYRDSNQLYLFDYYDDKHEFEIINKIKNIDMPFVRIGEMGDPSEDWQHTINICKIISKSKKPIVIITKHWNYIPENLLNEISKLNICINTSISALDNEFEIKYRLKQFYLLKNYCNSVLRIVSCEFNKKNKEGRFRAKIQDGLFDNYKIIDTIFRPSLNNFFVKNKIINIEKVKFLKSNIYASIKNENYYLGFCNNCPDMCGVKYNSDKLNFGETA